MCLGHENFDVASSECLLEVVCESVAIYIIIGENDGRDAARF